MLSDYSYSFVYTREVGNFQRNDFSRLSDYIKITKLFPMEDSDCSPHQTDLDLLF